MRGVVEAGYFSDTSKAIPNCNILIDDTRCTQKADVKPVIGKITMSEANNDTDKQLIDPDIGMFVIQLTSNSVNASNDIGTQPSNEKK